MRIKKEIGITLIALVVTIIILLILAGVTIGIATSGTGLFEKAKEATEKYQNAQNEENTLLAKFESQIDTMGSERATVNPNEISFANGNTGGFVATADSVDFKSYGLTYKSFPLSYLDSHYYAECKKTESRNLGKKFEVSLLLNYNNDIAADVGEIDFILSKNNETVLNLYIGEENLNYSRFNYTTSLGADNIGGITGKESINNSGRYAVVGDGSNIHVYLGQKEIVTTNYSDELSYDTIKIAFYKKNGGNAAPMHIESLYIGEPYYYKDFVPSN